MRERLHLILSTDARIIQIVEYGMAAVYGTMLQAYGAAFDLEVYSSDGTDYSRELGVRHHPLGPGADASRSRRILGFYANLIRRAPGMNGGIIRVVSPNLAVLPEVRRLARSPAIVDLHYDWAPTARAHYGGWKGLAAPRVQRRCVRAADLVIATTPELKRIAKERYGRRAIVIPNFVDPDLFRPSDQRQRMIIYAGRLHWAKGVDVLIRAFGHLARSHPECRLVLYGSGEEADALRACVPPGVNGRIEFRGSRPQEEVAHALGQASVSVLPTVTTEGNPKALLEAMACGTPLVATTVPGITSLIEDGKGGLLVPPGDPAAMASALARLLDDPHLWRRISDNLLTRSRRFARSRILERQVRVMRMLAQRGRTR